MDTELAQAHAAWAAVRVARAAVWAAWAGAIVNFLVVITAFWVQKRQAVSDRKNQLASENRLLMSAIVAALEAIAHVRTTSRLIDHAYENPGEFANRVPEFIKALGETGLGALALSNDLLDHYLNGHLCRAELVKNLLIVKLGVSAAHDTATMAATGQIQSFYYLAETMQKIIKSLETPESNLRTLQKELSAA